MPHRIQTVGRLEAAVPRLCAPACLALPCHSLLRFIAMSLMLQLVGHSEAAFARLLAACVTLHQHTFNALQYSFAENCKPFTTLPRNTLFRCFAMSRCCRLWAVRRRQLRGCLLRPAPRPPAYCSWTRSRASLLREGRTARRMAPWTGTQKSRDHAGFNSIEENGTQCAIIDTLSDGVIQ